MNCNEYTYDTVPKIIREKINEELFNYIKNHHIEWEEIANQRHCAKELADQTKQEWQIALKSASNDNEVSEINNMFESKYMKYYIEEKNLQDVLDSRDDAYTIYMKNAGFGNRTLWQMDERIIVFINYGTIEHWLGV